MIRKLSHVALALVIMLSALVVAPLGKASANHGPDDDWDVRWTVNLVAHGPVVCKFRVIDQGVGSNSYFQSRFWDNGCHKVSTGEQVYYGYVWRHAYVLRKAGLPQFLSYPVQLTGGYHEFTNTAYTDYNGGDVETLVALCDTFSGVCTYPAEF